MDSMSTNKKKVSLMTQQDIYTLTTEYKNEVANETNASLRSCELLYQIQSTLLTKYDNNTNNAKYKKEIALFRKDNDISKTQFNKRVSVGATLIRFASSNELRTLSIDAIYKQYCTTPKESKPKEPKIDYKNKYEQQLRMIEYIRDKMGIDAWNKFLSKYHSSSSNTAAMVED